MASLLRKLKNLYPSKRHPPPPTRTLYWHDVASLVQVQISWLNLPRSEWDPRRLAALKSFSAWRQEHSWLIIIGSVPSRASMEALLHIFDDLFFNGSLSAHTSFFWANLQGIEGVGGYVEGATDVFPGYGARIYLDLVWAGHIFSTLLHEMCHAYVDLFRCWGVEAGCTRWACQEGSRRYLKEVGAEKHGDVWTMLAEVVEESMVRDTGVRVELEWAQAHLRNP